MTQTQGLDCPICKDSQNNIKISDVGEDCFVSTKKGHIFHYMCLQRWVDEGKTTCPNCTETLGRNTVLQIIGVQSKRVSLHQEAVNAQINAAKAKILDGPPLNSLSCITAKIVALGEPGVGKSSLIKRFANEAFEDRYNATIGCDMNVKTIEVAGKLVQLHLWETAGQDRFRSLVTNYVRNADGILLVYDVTNASTFKSLDRWIAFANDYGPPDSIKILIGNKSDQKERVQISKRRGKDLAEKLQMPFFEASARNSHNVEVVFRTLAAEILLSPQIQERNTKNEKDQWGKSFSLTKNEKQSSQQGFFKNLACCS